ncbi:type I-U CRISPR-associated protein Csx17 [Limnochorda pilosa]|uniref:type I-G CRISPR-associated protein Cas8g1/Csx17 n=1 Tax=Limnochorda pilosa TaxID=1555112 RepID=UPI0026F015EB|nr:type I-U CRISPR-associated protein Csx17 [Limnochorda pilosa]
MPQVELAGCTPEPLHSYLKALGVFRIVGEQLDPDAEGWWQGGVFHLRSRFGADELVEALFTQYTPTPIVAPWNGGSGFFPKDKQEALQAIEGSDEPRLALYRETIARARSILDRLGIREKPDKGEKPRILAECRAWFPDEAVAWLDAAYVLTSEDPRYPPLLGTGGNDGRLEFSNNFMQRLLDALGLETGQPKKRKKGPDPQTRARGWLRGALFGEATPPLVPAAIGQYHPGGIGGPNATQGFEGDSLVNPWEFVLLLEGSLLLAGSAARRLGVDSRDKASFPFTVTGVGTGYASAVAAEYGSGMSRAEIWMPLWERPARLPEVRQVFAEGRAQWGGRQARTGTDFAQAAISLGVERGLSEFRRYGLLQRNGRAYLASPLGRLRVQVRPEARLLRELDPWLNSLRNLCTGNASTPASLWKALQGLDEAVLAYAAQGRERLLDVLLAAGAAEWVVAGRPRARGTRLQPIPALSPEWHDVCREETTEYRLAVALASIAGVRLAAARGGGPSQPEDEWLAPPIRANLEPVAWRHGRWVWAPESRSAVWGPGSLTRNLGNVLVRRATEAMARRVYPLPIRSPRPASLRDVHRFLLGQTDDRRLEALLRGLSLIDWSRGWASSGGAEALPPDEGDDEGFILPRAYAVLKLVTLDRPLILTRGGDRVTIRPEPAIFALLRANRVADACALALRRLRASGLVPMIRDPRDLAIRVDGERMLAALLIPVRETRPLARWALRTPATTDEPPGEAEATAAGG